MHSMPPDHLAFSLDCRCGWRRSRCGLSPKVLTNTLVSAGGSKGKPWPSQGMSQSLDVRNPAAAGPQVLLVSEGVSPEQGADQHV